MPPQEPDPEPSRDELNSDELAELVTHSQNRRVLRYLLNDNQPTIDLVALVDGIVHQDADSTSSQADQRNQIAIDLHHCRLPQLSDAGIIEYDPDVRIVANRLSQRGCLCELLLAGTCGTSDEAQAEN